MKCRQFFGLILASVTIILVSATCSTKEPLEPVDTGPSTWVRTYDKYWFNLTISVCEDPEGNIGLTGQAYYFDIDSAVTPWDSTLQTGVLVMKLGPTGDTLWYNVFGGPDHETGYHILPAYGGGYIVTGKTRSFGDGVYDDVYLLKVSDEGEQEWFRNFGGLNSDYGEHMQKTPDGGYILVGRTNSLGAGSYDMYVIKVNQFGASEWARTYGSINDDGADWVEVLSNGDFLIGGYTYAGGTDRQIFLVWTDLAGNEQWRRTFGLGDNESCAGVVELEDKGFLVVGSSSLPGGSNLYVARLDSLAILMWQKTINQPGEQTPWSITRTPDGGVVMSGGSTSEAQAPQRGYLAKIDINGNLLWDRLFGEGADQFALEGITNTSDGGLLVAGVMLHEVENRIKAYIIKTDANGLVH